MKHIILAFIALSSNVALAGVEEIMDATCKITLDTFCGTGTVFRQDDEYIWIIGAGHVGSPKTKGTVTFYHEGQPNDPIPVEVVWRIWERSTTNDLAFYKAKKPAGLKAAAVPLAPRNYQVQDGQVVLSYGCAHGLWPSMWRGKVLGTTETRLNFQPIPAIGRSGSAIFDRKGTMIIGIIVMSDGDDKGIAVPLSKIYQHLDKAK